MANSFTQLYVQMVFAVFLFLVSLSGFTQAVEI